MAFYLTNTTSCKSFEIQENLKQFMAVNMSNACSSLLTSFQLFQVLVLKYAKNFISNYREQCNFILLSSYTISLNLYRERERRQEKKDDVLEGESRKKTFFIIES